jgi:hypothetical protein
MMFNSYLRYSIVRNNAEKYSSFIKAFTIPKDSIIFSKIGNNFANFSQLTQNEIWKISPKPLIILNIVVNINWKKKKTKHKKEEPQQ